MSFSDFIYQLTPTFIVMGEIMFFAIVGYVIWFVYHYIIKPIIIYFKPAKKKKKINPVDYEIWFDKNLYRQTYMKGEDKYDFRRIQ